MDYTPYYDKARAGDLDAYAKLWKRYIEQAVRSRLQRYERLRHQLGDLVAETRYRLMRNLPKTRGYASVRGYACAIARTVAREALAQLCTQQLSEDALQSGGTNRYGGADQLMSRIVYWIESNLSGKRRDVLEHVLLLGRSQYRTHKELGISRRRVDQYLSEGLRDLRGWIQEQAWYYPACEPYLPEA